MLLTSSELIVSQVDLRLPPQEKRKPPGFPSFNLLWFLLPLFDAYVGPSRVISLTNPRLHPTLASLHDLPDAVLFVIPTMDFLLYEQLEMVERLQREAAQKNKRIASRAKTKRFEKLVFEGQVHGWLECAAFSCYSSSKDVSANEVVPSTLMDHHRVYTTAGIWHSLRFPCGRPWSKWVQ